MKRKPWAKRADAPKRIAGRQLQARRLRIWSEDPHCAACGRLTAYPSGFELDHRIAVHKGGPDTDENCQVLCAGDSGCHAKKTEAELGRRDRQAIGVDGWPLTE